MQFLYVLYAIGVGLLLFNLTIFIHELGHFLVGKWRGAKIERFAIWFGPAIWSRTIGGVEFRMGCIPLGGYVLFPQLAMEAIEGKTETPVEKLPPLTPRDRIPILFAGSFANVILGFLVATLVCIVGVPKDKSTLDLHIGYIPTESPEYAAGLRRGDEIKSINGKPVEDWDDIMQRVALSLSSDVQVGAQRGQELLTASVKPDREQLFGSRRLNLEPPSTPVADEVMAGSPAAEGGIQKGDEFVAIEGERILAVHHFIDLISTHGNQPTHIRIRRDGQEIDKIVTPLLEKTAKAPRIGVKLKPKGDEGMITVHPGPWSQVKGSLIAMIDTFNALTHHKETGVGVGDLSGPVGIGWMLYERVKIDFRLALQFLVILNINLAIVNLLPIPVLDGGHIVFAIIEAIRRRPVSPKLMEATQTVFIALLLTFIVYVTFNDLTRMKKVSSWRKDESSREAPPPQVFENKPSPAPVAPATP